MSARIHPTAFIAPTAAVMGEVTLGEESSVWYGVVVRADDMAPIVIGAQSNLQDGTIVHVDEGCPAWSVRGLASAIGPSSTAAPSRTNA